MRTAPITLAGRSHHAAPPIMKPKTSAVEDPALIVFGYDESGKAHASCFGQADAELAGKAASLMGYFALAVTTGEHGSLAAGLPAGRVFASGRAFVPFVKGATFDAIATAAGVTPAVPAPKPKPTLATQVGGEGSDGKSDAAHLPLDWQQIQQGSLVLASVGESDGWYEAIVIEVKPEDLFIVKWRDWPEDPVLVRRREHLGLLHPEFQAGR